jgi:hypothetical protein
MSLPLAGNIGDQDEIEGTAETADEEQSPDSVDGISVSVAEWCLVLGAANLQT